MGISISFENNFLLSRKVSWHSERKTSCEPAITSLMEYSDTNVTFTSLLHFFWKTKPKSCVWAPLSFTSSERIQYSTWVVKCFTITLKNTRTGTASAAKHNPMMLIMDDLKGSLNIDRPMRKTASRSPWHLPGETDSTHPSSTPPSNVSFITRSPQGRDQHCWEDMDRIHS